jgi:UDP-N-acetyl-D-mannosaminuronic acid dehydrogenase
MFDVTIIGCGRVGLPLALSLEEKGLAVEAIDLNRDLINSVNNKKMPFLEPGYDKLLEKSKIQILDASLLLWYPESKAFIITVGTPLMQHIETDLSQVKGVIDNLVQKAILKDILIVLRSTVAPNTTKFIKEYIENKTKMVCGKDFYLAMCPERLAEGKAYEELSTLPQIIGTYDEASYLRAKNIFSVFGVDIIQCTPEEAELAKLFTNIFRYINMSIPNYFSYIADSFGVDIYTLLKIMNKDYPRNKGLLKPGFSKGTCLVKDWGMINENFSQSDLLMSSYKVNEFGPKFYVDLLKDKIKNKNIGILGYTFKADTDDTRDNLTPKLIRYINRYIPNEIYINEPNLPHGPVDDFYNNYKFYNKELQEVIKNSDILIIAINHKSYYTIDLSILKNKIVIDGWGILNKKLLNYF